MATTNAASVREEIACIEQGIARLNEIRKVTDESQMFFNTLLMIVNIAGRLRPNFTTINASD